MHLLSSLPDLLFRVWETTLLTLPQQDFSLQPVSMMYSVVLL